MSHRFQGILFDFDGTLADTMESHFLAWQSVLAEYAVTISRKDYFPLEGLGLREVAEMFTQDRGLSETDINEIVQRKKKYYLRSHRVSFYPGVKSLVNLLKNKKIPMGVVTAGHLDQLKGSVPASFLDQFDSLVTGEQLTRGKPHPEPYLRGAKDLGLQPNQCIAVENAPIGVESAKRAGIYCIALCTTVSRDCLVEANEIVEDFKGLRKNLAIQKMLDPL